MSVLWTSEDAAAATGGRNTRDWEAGGVSIDSRTIEPGDLFIALKAERDGHDFVAAALSNGAAAAMVSHVPDGVAETAPLLVVDDVQAALEALGHAGRERSKARVIAITGSAGKTSTKEMLRSILRGQGSVHAAEASYNNHWGVPLTLARMPADTDYAVIEIGMNAPGEISPLSKMARPHVAVVTTIAAAHLAAFDDLRGIAVEKASIFDGLVAGGTAIVNADCPETDVLVDGARHASRLVRFGEAEDADVHLQSVDLAENSTVVHALFEGTPRLFKIGAAGRHFAMNALAALAAAEVAGADPAIAACDMAMWSPPSGRGTRERLPLDIVDDHLTIDLIDDAFNANPASMAAALEVLTAVSPVDGVGRVERGRRIAILGDMLELGEQEKAMHADIAAHPGIERIALVHCVGPRMSSLWNALPEAKRGRWTETAEEMAAQVHQLVDAGDVVLVKGSKGSRVSLVVDALRKQSHPEVETA